MSDHSEWLDDLLIEKAREKRRENSRSEWSELLMDREALLTDLNKPISDILSEYNRKRPRGTPGVTSVKDADAITVSVADNPTKHPQLIIGASPNGVEAVVTKPRYGEPGVSQEAVGVLEVWSVGSSVRMFFMRRSDAIDISGTHRMEEGPVSSFEDAAAVLLEAFLKLI